MATPHQRLPTGIGDLEAAWARSTAFAPFCASCKKFTCCYLEVKLPLVIKKKKKGISKSLNGNWILLLLDGNWIRLQEGRLKSKILKMTFGFAAFLKWVIFGSKTKFSKKLRTVWVTFTGVALNAFGENIRLVSQMTLPFL